MSYEKILITGGLGFSGSVLSEHLLKGYHVTVIDRILFNNRQIKNFSNKKNFQFYIDMIYLITKY